MVLAPNVVETIAHQREEICIGRQDMPRGVEFDHSLRAFQRLDLAAHVKLGLLARRDVAGELDHADHPALGVEDRRIARLDPDVGAGPGPAQKLARKELALAKFLPKGGIDRTLTLT